MSKRSPRKPRGRQEVQAGRLGRRTVLLGALGLGAGGLTLGLWPRGTARTAHAYALAPESVLDANVRRAPAKVREAYRFAIANRALLNQIPCFCGCGAEGHRGNADCYVEEVRPDGTVTFDYMSLG